MAGFNSATMIDVTRPNISVFAEFTGSISAFTGILSVTGYTKGQIASQMVLTANGFDKVYVTGKLTAQAGEIERWQTLRMKAGVYASATAGIATVSSIWYGSLATLGDAKYLLSTQDLSGANAMVVQSVDANGIGTYRLELAGVLQTSTTFTSQRMFVAYLANASQNIPAGTAFTGGELESASAVAPTTNQAAILSRLRLAAASCSKGLYFPPGRYIGLAGLSDVDVYGASSKGTDAQRSVLQLDYSITNPWATNLNSKSLNDLYLDGLDPGNCKTIKNCYFWMPDSAFTITGGISGTTLTVETLSPGGFVFVGAAFTGTGVTRFTIVSCLSGTPGGIGTYQISASQTVASGTAMAASIDIDSHYFSSDSLASGADYEIVGNTFDLPGVYSAVWVTNPKTALVSRNIFPERMGFTSHVIRVEALDGLAERIEVTYNKIDRVNITGIFAGSNRLAPIRNLIMDWNEVYKNTEEAIAIDGFGDNVGLCPCICNGRLTTLTNDANGRLVVSLSEFIYATSRTTRARMTVAARDLNLTGYVSGDVFTTTAAHNGYLAPGATLKGDGVPDRTLITGIISRPGIGNSGSLFRLNRSFTLGSAGSPVTVKMADWKKFKFIFSEGTGSDGAIVDIYDYDATNNTVTLDLFRSASLFTTGANTWAGIHVGFFGGSCSHNKVGGESRTLRNADTIHSTGISLFHNVFNFDVGYNEIVNQANGIRVAGGYMLSAYHVLAYNNSLHDNIVTRLSPIPLEGNTLGGIGINNDYGGIAQLGNRVVNNNCTNANVILQGEANTICEGNILVGDNAKTYRTFPPSTLPATAI